MGDNTILPGTGEVYASEEITETSIPVNYQKVKLVTGPAGVANVGSSIDPLEVHDTTTNSVMGSILQELRLMNLHLSILTKLDDVTSADMDGET